MMTDLAFDPQEVDASTAGAYFVLGEDLEIMQDCYREFTMERETSSLEEEVEMAYFCGMVDAIEVLRDRMTSHGRGAF